MAAKKQSDRIRALVAERYVRPAFEQGNVRLSIRVRDVLRDAEATPDFPRGRTPLICEVLQGKKLLSENGLEIESVDGPPSKQSRTVVVHYRRSQLERSHPLDIACLQPDVPETPAARAKRLTGKLNGLLKDEIATFGGADALMRWLRSDEGETRTIA